MGLRSKTLYRIGHRPALLLGGDREVVLLFGVLGAALMLQGTTVVAKVTGIALWGFGLWWGRAMAKRDPLWRRVWMRRRQYAGVYLARATPFRENTPRQAKRYRR